MPTYSNNNLPVFPQRSTSDFVHPFKGVGTYSNYQLNSTTQLLQDAPLEHHVPGEGRHPHDVQMSRWFTGEGQINIQPLAEPGGDPEFRPTYYRFHPLEWKGVPSAAILNGDDWGHLPFRQYIYTHYSNYLYDGVGDQNNRLADPGHYPRSLGDEGAPATFGRTDPWDFQSKSIAAAGPLEAPGHNIEYGEDHTKHFDPKRWRGVPSARAL